MNNVSALSTNTRCTTNWNNRSAKAKNPNVHSPLTNAMRFLECGHNHGQALWNANNQRPKNFKIKLNSPGVYEEIVQLDWCKEVFRTKFRLLVSCHCHRWLGQIVVKNETPGVNGGFNNCLTVSAATKIHYARLIALFSLMIGCFWLVLKNTNIDWIRIENCHTWSIIFGGWVVVGGWW